MGAPIRATILAPAYNEEEVIERFAAAVLTRLEEGWEILFVDDGSRDRTPEILRNAGRSNENIRVVTHELNRGLGAALATGFREARGEIVVTMDADLSHPLDLLPSLIDACDSADAAYASRYVKGGGMVGVPWKRALISRAANLLLRIAFATRVKDLTTGFRAYRREAIADLNLTGKGFEAQLEISVRLLAGRRRIVEIPFILTERAAGTSKMRYLPLISRYGRMMLRMLRVRWFGPDALP